MSRKKFLRQAPRVRTSMKMAMVIGGSSIAGLVVLLLVVFNLSKQEESRAGNTQPQMTFINAETFQDTSLVLRGSSVKAIIGVIVETKGSSSPLKAGIITFNLNGTTKPASKNIENIKLFYTNNDAKFYANSQVGATIVQAPEGEFKIDASKQLLPGKNYFWLTADVKSSATPNGSVDAECISINIGSTEYLTLLAAPEGEKRIRNNNAYYSTGNKDGNSSESWNNKRDGTGSKPSNMNDALNCFFIQKGHTITASENTYMPMVAIEGSGKLIVDDNLRTNELNISTSGVCQFNVTANDCRCIGKLVMEDNANYIHNSTGIFAAGNALLSKESQVVFFKYDEKTFPSGIKWGNVLIDASESIHTNIRSAFNNVQGNLEIAATAGNALYIEGNDVMNIAGGFILSGGIFEGVRGNNSILKLNIGKNLVVKGGVLKDVENSYTSNAFTQINIGGDVMIASGQVRFANAENGKSEMNFVDKSNKSVRWTQKNKADVELGNINIKEGKEVFVKGDLIGDIAKDRTFTVETGGKLWCHTYPVTGEGKFILNDKATLAIGHAKGINSKKKDGNIQTEQKQFHSGATYVYYTGSTPQETGDFATVPVDGKVRNLIIRKENPAQTVVLSRNIEVSEIATVGMGTLDKKEFDIKGKDLSGKIKGN